MKGEQKAEISERKNFFGKSGPGLGDEEEEKEEGCEGGKPKNFFLFNKT